MERKRGYSRLIRPILFLLDLLIISLFSYFFLSKEIIETGFIITFWVVLSVIFSFYSVYRFTKIIKIISLIFKQVFILVLLFFSYLYIQNLNLNSNRVIAFFLTLSFVLCIWRIVLYYVFKKYRILTGSNYKRVVIVGFSVLTKNLENFFNNELGYGYKFMGFFTDDKNDNKKGSIAEIYDFIIENKIDEVYCSVKELTNNEIKYFIDFCDVNFKTLKFIPDNKELFRKNLYLNYYDITPVLSIRKIPLDDPINNITKRVFDVMFSTVIIIFILSWLIPVLGLIIIMESKGPIFFQQNRPGIKEEGFGCYKFRSMTINSRSEDSATRNDARITKVGKFIRKTSLDELPQFFNVLFGEMSVVGPRPHLWRQNEIYGTKIPKYMVRHFVKPGVTGLAQVRGYRGEIESREDIVNRTKYDIFYIENWSLLLDLKIILQTVINVFKGEEKAY